MKKALVLSLFVMLGVGVACSAQLQGTWDTWLKLDIGGTTVALDGFYSFLDVQYLVGGWTLAASTLIDQDGLDAIWFEGYGSLGAFSMWSLVTFDPTPYVYNETTDQGAETQTASFTTFQNLVAVSIAGVDLYAAFYLGNVYDAYTCDFYQTGFGTASDAIGFGSGFLFGGIGTAGDIKIGAEVAFNLYSILWDVWLYGAAGVGDWTYTNCSSDTWYPLWSIGYFAAIQTGCDVAWSSITAVVEFPLCCADVYVGAGFSCTGFDYLAILLRNIDIGLNWLKIADLNIVYGLNSKSISFYFQVVTGDVVCFKPYFNIVMDSTNKYMLDGIELNALTLSCTLGGCEFYWGHMFDPTKIKYSSYYWPSVSGYGIASDYYYFQAVGLGLTTAEQCAFYADFTGHLKTLVRGTYDPAEPVLATTDFTGYIYPNEVVGIQCDEDSCCGGLFSFSIGNFFAAGDALTKVWWADATNSDDCKGGWRWGTADSALFTGIFGWMGSYFELGVGVGSNVTLEGSLKVTVAGVDSVGFGVNVAW
jgi:hypothetical protein